MSESAPESAKSKAISAYGRFLADALDLSGVSAKIFAETEYFGDGGIDASHVRRRMKGQELASAISIMRDGEVLRIGDPISPLKQQWSGLPWASGFLALVAGDYVHEFIFLALCLVQFHLLALDAVLHRQPGSPEASQFLEKKIRHRAHLLSKMLQQLRNFMDNAPIVSLRVAGDLASARRACTFKAPVLQIVTQYSRTIIRRNLRDRPRDEPARTKAALNEASNGLMFRQNWIAIVSQDGLEADERMLRSFSEAIMILTDISMRLQALEL